MPCSLLKVKLTFNRHYIPEDRTLHNHCCENLKSYKLFLVPTSFYKRRMMLNISQHTVTAVCGQKRNRNMAQFWKSVVKEGTLESVDHKFLE
jgi:hypothetical protein